MLSIYLHFELCLATIMLWHLRCCRCSRPLLTMHHEPKR